MVLNEQEKTCLRILAKWFKEGKLFRDADLESFSLEGLEIDRATMIQMLHVMDHIGAIENADGGGHGLISTFYVMPKVIPLAREMEEAENKPEDIVEKLKNKARSNDIAAWAIIAVVVLSALVTMANQSSQLIERIIGWIAKP